MNETPTNTHPIMHPYIDFDVPGLIRKVRRVCDLSQRDLAQRLRVAQSTVARWETGQVEPSISTFRRLLALADWDLQVRDPDDREPAPMRPDAVRDQQGRRCPAHLDVRTFNHFAPAHTTNHDRHWCVPGRWERDSHRQRRHGLIPHDHPNPSEIQDYLSDLTWRQGRQLRRHLARTRAQQAAPGWVEPHCTCPDACFTADHCTPDCTCACDAAPTSTRPPT